MTTTPITESVGMHVRDSARRPVQVDIDGDFALDDLLALPDGGPARRITATRATSAVLWQLDVASCGAPAASHQSGASTVSGTPSDTEATLLHRIETSGLLRPPVRERIAALTPERGEDWLALAAHWIDLSRACGDLRYLNAACKLTGAVWSRLHSGDGTRRGRGLAGQLGAVGRLLGKATDRLRSRLADRVLLAEPPRAGEEVLHVAGLAGTRLADDGRARIAVLARAGSGSVARLVTAATAAGLPVVAVCWYAAPHSEPVVPSNYASAWYPPAAPDLPHPSGVPNGVPAITARSWEDVTVAIRTVDADLVLLLGMPVVPVRVLNLAKLGVLNAHNGALPSHRGMDAVGWALLHNQPIVCSLHLARPAVDAGEIIAAHPVPAAPARTLAARVKTAQLRLLLAGAAHVAATGTLPDLCPQPAAGTQFYRLHPHLKRLLDTSPYAHDDHPEATVTQP